MSDVATPPPGGLYGLSVNLRLPLGLREVVDVARALEALDARGQRFSPREALSLALAVGASVITAGLDGPHHPRPLIAEDPKPPSPPPDPARVLAWLASVPNVNTARPKGRRKGR